MSSYKRRKLKRKLLKHMNLFIYTAIFTGTVIFTVVNASGKEDFQEVNQETTVMDMALAKQMDEEAELELPSNRAVSSSAKKLDIETNQQSTYKKEEVTTINIEPGTSFTANVPSGSCVNIRKSASTESDIVGRMYIGAGGTVVEYGEKWTKVSSGSVEGYVSNDFVIFGKTAAYTAVSVQEEQEAAQEAARKAKEAQEEASRQAEQNQTVPVEEPTTQKETQPETTKPPVEETTSKGVETDLSKDDAYLLACIVYSEAGGESYEGQLAVANIVLNRLYKGSWGGSVTSVIYAPGQFSPVTNGTLAATINSGPSASASKAAKSAMSGNNNIGSRLFFRGIGGGYGDLNGYKIIGNHVFY